MENVIFANTRFMIRKMSTKKIGDLIYMLLISGRSNIEETETYQTLAYEIASRCRRNDSLAIVIKEMYEI